MFPRVAGPAMAPTHTNSRYMHLMRITKNDIIGSCTPNPPRPFNSTVLITEFLEPNEVGPVLFSQTGFGRKGDILQLQILCSRSTDTPNLWAAMMRKANSNLNCGTSYMAGRLGSFLPSCFVAWRLIAHLLGVAAEMKLQDSASLLEFGLNACGFLSREVHIHIYSVCIYIYMCV